MGFLSYAQKPQLMQRFRYFLAFCYQPDVQLLAFDSARC